MSLLSDDFAREIFFEIHDDLLRQGPGSVQSSLHALSFITSNNSSLNILDIGCGPGIITIELAKLGHRITALDNHQAFIDQLLTQAKKEHVSDRIIVLHGDMFCLENFVSSTRFDLIWSEGSIYIIGFERGLTEWKKFLNEHGYFVCSEVTWLTTNPPVEAREFWSKNYPGMCTQDENIQIIQKCGYELVHSFILAEKDWWQAYYEPMEKRIHELRIKYKGHQEAENVLDEQQNEIDLYRKYSNSYGYVFYVMKILPNSLQ